MSISKMFKRWRLKVDSFAWILWGRCPCCGAGYFRFIKTETNGILVNIFSKGRVDIPGFWIPSDVCKNPACEWSKVEVESQNLCSAKSAWEAAEKGGD